MDLKSSFSKTTVAPFYAGSGAVASVTSDGSLLATCIIDKVNVISLTEPKKIIHEIENNDEQELTALKLTGDGRYVCFVSQNQLLRIYNLEKKQVTRSIKLSSPVYVADCDETSTLLAVGGTDGSVNVIDIENGYITHSFKGHGGTISSLKFYGELNSENWLLASGDTEGVVKIWDLVKRRCLHTMNEHTAAVRGLDFQLDDSNLKLLSGGRDDIIMVHQFDSKKKCKLLQTIPINQQVEACGFIKGHDSLVYTAGGDGMFKIWSQETGKSLRSTKKPIEELFVIGVLPINNGSGYYLVLNDQTLLRINIERALDLGHEYIPIDSTLSGNHGIVADMKLVGPELNMLALATNSPTLRIIQVPASNGNTDECTMDTDMYDGHSDMLNALDASADGRWLASASRDHSIILWRYVEERSMFQQYAKFIGHVGPVTAVGLPNVMNHNWPSFLLSASNDLTIKKWVVPKPANDSVPQDTHIVKTSEYTRRAHEKDINALSLSPNDSTFATASYDKTAKVWDLDTGELVATLANHKRGLWNIAYCQYDKLIATCSGDKTIKIWSLDNFTVTKTLEGHTNAVQRVSFINRNKQLVSTGADGLVKIWDYATGECVRTLDAHDNRIWALTVADDGDLIITADADGVFQFWRDNSEQELELNLEKEKLKVEQEQSLKNYISAGDWTNAFLLAMSLDHPMRLYNVLKKSMSSTLASKDSNTIFNEELDNIFATLDNDQILKLMKRCRDWNTNARTHQVSQKVIKCILMKHNICELSEIPGLIPIIDAITPYIERHYARVDNLVEQSYLLDHALLDMAKLF
ncbi:HHR197Cp [Eremothecium sinecaudum]|uniref:HHR197Cp n=1 Tax=Eremothecium sinecaudum TaxID=45286 RepID=A0A109UYQ1_9SACH|nr:HHR197Cp [Eremothecium sinecaudum]AMD22966.1 HHR197Cp [Eremothecium sinecaudum]